MELLIDGVIVLAYFAGILTLGLYMGRREKSLHDFALGGRRVPWWAVMASVIAAETSAATFLGVPGEGYKSRSIVYAQLVIGLVLGRILAAFVFLKPFYLYRVYTVYDYLAIRFGPWTKNYVSALFLIMRTLASGARVFVPAIVMVLAFATEPSNLTPYIIAILLLTILTCIYTAIGGIKAVIWTDLVQATIMCASALLAMGTILYHLGDSSLSAGLAALTTAVPEMKTLAGYVSFGWEPALTQKWLAERNLAAMTAWEWIRLTLASEYTLASAAIGYMLVNLGAFGTDQDMVQRLLTAETYKKSRRSLITAALMDLPIFAGFAFIGVLLIAYYQRFPTYKPADNADVFGAYIIHVLPTGIRGLVLAGVFATAMGSLSAALNALATSATNDWYIPYFARNRSESHHVAAARVFTAIFAALMAAIAIGSAYVKISDPDFRIIPFVIGIAGIFLGPMLGVFLLGMLTRRRGSDAGNITALTVSLLAMFFLTGQHVAMMNILFPAPRGTEPYYHLPASMPVIKWTWYALFGAGIVVAIGLLFRTPDETVAAAHRHAATAGTDDRPVALRDAT